MIIKNGIKKIQLDDIIEEACTYKEYDNNYFKEIINEYNEKNADWNRDFFDMNDYKLEYSGKIYNGKENIFTDDNYKYIFTPVAFMKFYTFYMLDIDGTEHLYENKDDAYENQMSEIVKGYNKAKKEFQYKYTKRVMLEVPSYMFVTEYYDGYNRVEIVAKTIPSKALKKIYERPEYECSECNKIIKPSIQNFHNNIKDMLYYEDVILGGSCFLCKECSKGKSKKKLHKIGSKILDEY